MHTVNNSGKENKLNVSAHTFDCQVVTEKLWKIDKDWPKLDRVLAHTMRQCSQFLMLKKTAFCFKDLIANMLVFTFIC